jgi:hypothetical protein
VYTFHTPRYAGSAIPPQSYVPRDNKTRHTSGFQIPARISSTITNDSHYPEIKAHAISVSVPIHLQPSLHAAYIKLYQAKLFTHHNSFSAPRRQRQGDHHQSTP